MALCRSRAPSLSFSDFAWSCVDCDDHHTIRIAYTYPACAASALRQLTTSNHIVSCISRNTFSRVADATSLIHTTRNRARAYAPATLTLDHARAHPKHAPNRTVYHQSSSPVRSLAAGCGFGFGFARLRSRCRGACVRWCWCFSKHVYQWFGIKQTHTCTRPPLGESSAPHSHNPNTHTHPHTNIANARANQHTHTHTYTHKHNTLSRRTARTHGRARAEEADCLQQFNGISCSRAVVGKGYTHSRTPGAIRIRRT